MDVSDIFNFFFSAWGGEGGLPRGGREGVGFFIENPRRGGGGFCRRGRGRGAGRVSAANWEIFFGGGG